MSSTGSMYYANYLRQKDIVIISKNVIDGCQILCSKQRSIARIHWSMLKQFKLTDGSYMMSNELLVLISKIFKIDYEDLWNKIYFHDQIYLEDPITFVVRPKRTDEGWLSDLGILGDQLD